MVEYFVADEENAGKHVLDNRISADASLIKCVQELAASQTLLLNIRVQLNQSWEELLVEGEAQLEGCNRKRSIFDILSLNGK